MKMYSAEGLSDLLFLHIEARRKELTKWRSIRYEIDADDRSPLHNTNYANDFIKEFEAKLLALEVLQNGIHPESSEFE